MSKDLILFSYPVSKIDYLTCLVHKINTVIFTTKLLLLSLMHEGREKYCGRYNYKNTEAGEITRKCEVKYIFKLLTFQVVNNLTCSASISLFIAIRSTRQTFLALKES